MKLEKNGTPDADWGDGGVAVVPGSSMETAYNPTLMVDTIGNLIAETKNNEFVRLLPNGQIDPSWGEAGLLSVPKIEYVNNFDILQTPRKNILVAEISESLANQYRRSENHDDYNITLKQYDPKSGQLDSDKKIIIVPRIINGDLHLVADNEYVYIAGSNTEDSKNLFVEKYDLADGNIVSEWGNEGVKKYGSWFMFGGNISGIKLDKIGNVIMYGATGTNLGGPTCNAPDLSCGASFGYVVKIEG